VIIKEGDKICLTNEKKFPPYLIFNKNNLAKS
jgi:hypothetical protein